MTRLAFVVLMLVAMPADVVTAEDTRVVGFTPDTEAREVSRYFSLHAHGPTLKFYAFPDRGIVAVVRAAATDAALQTTVDVHVFAATVDADGIAKWINNQHSDALYADAAQPERSFTVDPTCLHVKTSEALEHEVGDNGDEYDRHRVEFSIDAFTNGDVEFRPSRGTLDAFVRTKDIAARAPGPDGPQ